jgi:HEPN domain-containing protein
MPHDPEKIAEVRDWMARARQDLLAAQVLLEALQPLGDVAVFHCQQAAEKALKGFLAWHDAPFRKTHEIEELGQACERIDGTLVELVRRAVDLTPFAWRFRYPGEVSAPSREDAEDALTVARDVYSSIASRLPAEATL